VDIKLQDLTSGIFRELGAHGHYFFTDSQNYYIYDSNTYPYDYDKEILLKYPSSSEFLEKGCHNYFTRQDIYNIINEYLTKTFNISYDSGSLVNLIRRLYTGFLCNDEEDPKISNSQIKEGILAGIYSVHKIIKDVNYDNNDVIINKGKQRFLNLYQMSPVFKKGLEISKNELIEVNTTQFKNINDFLKAFMDNDEETLAYVINYIAWWLQNLGKVTPQIAFMMAGTEGFGKGMFVEKVLCPMLNVNDWTKMTIEDWKRFNSKLEYKFLVFTDEVIADKFMRALIKNNVANDRISIEGKGKESHLINNHALFMFAKNNMHEDTVLDDGKNRRYSIIFNGQDLRTRWGDEKVIWWNTEFFKSPEYWDELTYFIAYLLRQKINLKKIVTPLQNAARDLIEENEKDRDLVLSEISYRLKKYLEVSVRFNLDELPDKLRDNIICIFDEKEKRFIFSRPNLLNDLSQKLKKKKSFVIAQLFEKFNFKFVDPDRKNNHISTLFSINSVWLFIDEKSNRELYNSLKGHYFTVYNKLQDGDDTE
jgi:hypothetical protein